MTEATVTVLDGGLSTALEEAGADLSGSLWTARLLAEEPDRIRDAHRAFFAAGAQVATTASYQGSVEGFASAGYDDQRAPALLTLSVRLAQEARDEQDRPGLLVAASIGPYGAFLADGSEYTGRYGVSRTRLRDFHGPRMELLAEAGPDLLAVETIPDVEEAEVLVELLDELELPAWFCYSVRGDTTCAGQPLHEAYDVLAGHPTIRAAGVNCSDPADVLGAIRVAAERTKIPAVAYPNRGGEWDNEATTWRYDRPVDLDLLDAWVEAGARWVGGCCGHGPADLARLAGRLADLTR